MDHLKPIVAIHQPNFIPWLGYFMKIYLSDVFVFHDDVIFNARSYTKRVQVRKELLQEEKQWLGIPIKKTDQSKISVVEIDHDSLSVDKLVNKFSYIYKNAPHFDEYFPHAEKLIQHVSSYSLLAEYNIFTIQQICKVLGIETRFEKSSEQAIDLHKNDLNLALVKKFNGKSYLSGIGAKEYQDPKTFTEQNIRLVYVEIHEYLEQHPYTQKQGEFVGGLTIFDALFNIGKDGIIALFENYKDHLSNNKAL